MMKSIGLLYVAGLGIDLVLFYALRVCVCFAAIELEFPLMLRFVRGRHISVTVRFSRRCLLHNRPSS
jgi:hypothetical protein